MTRTWTDFQRQENDDEHDPDCPRCKSWEVFDGDTLVCYTTAHSLLQARTQIESRLGIGSGKLTFRRY